MAWTTPKTWNVGDPATAADLNTYVRDNVGFLYGDTSWQSLGLGNGWVAGITPGFRKLGTIVIMRGTVTSGTTGQVIGTLPLGYRPPQIAIFAVDSNGAYGNLQIGTDGGIVCYAGTNARIAFDTVRFDTLH